MCIRDSGLGDNGWSPILSLTQSGERVFLRIIGWTGGEGQEPPVGYIGIAGISSDFSGAFDLAAALGFVDISANPSEDATESISKIKLAMLFILLTQT